jgi:hypothetical protein
MPEYALQVVPDDEHHDRFRWLLLEEVDENPLSYIAYEGSDCDFKTWGDALNAGTLALARACGHGEYENEAADPVGDTDCAQPIGPAAYVSRANPRAQPKEDAPRPGQTSNRYGSKAS